jgi:hypothetical protein
MIVDDQVQIIMKVQVIMRGTYGYPGINVNIQLQIWIF